MKGNGCLFENCAYLHRGVFCRHKDLGPDHCPRKKEWEAIENAKKERKRREEENQKVIEKEMEEQAEPIGYTYMGA